MQNYHRKRNFAQEEAFSPFPAYICISIEKTNSYLKRARLHILLILSLLSLASTSNGQWTKVMESDTALVFQINFDESDILPLTGFASVGLLKQDSNVLFRTTDGGFTWNELPSSKNYSNVFTISIKNKDTAWIFRGDNSGVDVPSQRTTDGGLTWNDMSVSGLFEGSYFNRSNNLLIANRFSYGGYTSRDISTDNGNSWNSTQTTPDDWVGHNILFADSLYGFEGSGRSTSSPFANQINRTTDGGKTWIQTNTEYESCWSGVAIQKTRIGFLASHYTNNILGTQDGGATWDTVHHFLDTNLTGSIVGDLCHLYVQASAVARVNNEDKRGVFESTDQGKTWVKIADFCGLDYFGMFFRNDVLFVGDMQNGGVPEKPSALWRYQVPPNKPTIVAPSIVLSLKQCEIVDTIISIAAINQCDGEKVVLDTVFTIGSSAFTITDKGNGREIYWDTLKVKYIPSGNREDTAFVHLRFKLKGNTFDTVMMLLGSYNPPRTAFLPAVSDSSLSLETISCFGKEQTVYYSLLDSCIGTKGILLSSTVSGSTNFQVTADDDSAIVIYIGAGYDTAKLALKFRLYEYEYDTVITLYGYPSATKDSLSFLATLTKPSVTWEETTELRVTPDKAAVNKRLAEIRFDVTLDADVLEPLTNFTTGITGASIVMSNPTPVGKLMRYPFVVTGNNMTLDPAVSILRLPMRPYLSDTTMTTIELSSFTLNGFDPDYERCMLSATGDGTPFTLELMCGDSLLSRYLGGKPILTITSLKPNPTKADVTVTFDLAKSGAVKAEVLDVLGNVVKQETLEATQGETKYNISLPDAAEGVYYVRLRYGAETRTVKFVRE